MAEIAIEAPPSVDDLVTEDDTPVDNIFSEKGQRLLTEPLYSAWSGEGDERKFIAAANVGVFWSVHEPPVVPDMFLSLDCAVGADLYAKKNRSYFVWQFGKPPEVVVEIVSNREGNETGSKRELYAHIGVTYYAIFDPQGLVQREPLCVYALTGGRYTRYHSKVLNGVGLGLVIWQGEFEGSQDATWLRWCDVDGRLIPTGRELADAAQQRADAAQQRADAEQQRADAEQQRAERLEARLRALGQDPSIV